MTSVNNSSRPPQAPRDPSPANGRARPEPGDVHAMKEALDAARGRMDRGQAGAKKLTTGHAQAGAEARAEPNIAGRPPAYGNVKHQQKHEGNEALTGWGAGPGAVVPTMVTADVAAAHVDPGAFAQMLADLWTRENGKGAKEVLVRFGNRTWPATGARLVRNAAGGLDVALMVGDGGRAYGDRMPQLEAALNDAGVTLGSLELSTES